MLSGKVKVLVPTMLLMLTHAIPAYAVGDVSSMSLMASSAEMQGTTEFYYSNQWLVKFVQFVISWMCIIALLVFYAGWMCSMVVLSNKELFYLIDTIKKESSEGANGGEQKGWSGVNAVIHSFKNGSSDGVNGGLDNVLLFILALSINFKAYSYYKNVEAGSEDNASGGKFNYNDTMLNFLLKTLIPAVTVTFVCSVAISGVLLSCWFTISDVFSAQAQRFAQTNLVAKVDAIIGNTGTYAFTLGNSELHGPLMAEQIARKMYATTVGQFPNATPDQRQAIGLAIENEVHGAILGNSSENYYATLEKWAKGSVPDGAKDTVMIKNEDQSKLLGVRFDVNINPQSATTGAYTVSMKDILEKAGVSSSEVNTRYQENLYMHTIFRWDGNKAGGMTQTGGGGKKEEDVIVPIDTDGVLNP